jgi:glycosyltransferase involved in cell wall biosynthesis
MATYNGEKYVQVQLASILNQLSHDDEVVIVDDASTDNTVEIILGFNDKRIRLYRNDQKKGAVRNFDRALHLVRGDLVFLSDQDDRWYDNKVATVRSLFESSDLDLVVHDARVISDSGVLNESLFRMCKSSPGIFRNIIGSTYTGCCMVLRKEMLDRVLPIPDEKGIFHDSWIGIMSDCLRWKKMFLPVPLMEYRRHGGNVSTMKTRGLFQIIPERIRLIAAILSRMFFGAGLRNSSKEKS